MKIIGEKINGTRSRVGRAIAERDAEFIRSLARRQAEAGCDWIDVHAGTAPDREADDLIWLVNLVQQSTDVPLCLDSSNPEALALALDVSQRTPMINSISGEPNRLSGILPLVARYGCPTVALCLDRAGIPRDGASRLDVLRRVLEATRAAGIADDRVYADPLVMTIATSPNSVNVALETMRTIRAEFPDVHLTTGLSNVSFGLPERALINRTFLALAVAAGLDSAIIDPLDTELRSAILATELLLGRDRHCLNYIRAHRAGGLNSRNPKAVAQIA